MKPTKEEFKRLQRVWYEKLKEQGFKDIEKYQGEECVLTEASSIKRNYLQRVRRLAKESYYSLLDKALRDEKTVFRNETDKYILFRHAEGAFIKTIVQELIVAGTPRERKSIRFIIRRYEMELGIKSYTPKQLNAAKYD